VLIVGVGNAYRHDDAVGLVAARRLRETVGGDARLWEAGGEGTALMEAWQGVDTVLLIDAVRSGAPAGTVHRVDAHAGPVPAALFRGSTHAFNVAEAIELARALNRLPPRLILFGIEGIRFDAGVGLSPDVAQAVDAVVCRGVEDISQL
jgi:hydrogenase maturation protease